MLNRLKIAMVATVAAALLFGSVPAEARKKKTAVEKAADTVASPSPAPSAAASATAAAATDSRPAATTDVVYVTKAGKKYHRAGCKRLGKNATETTLAQAKEKGLTACKVCKP